MCGLSASVGLNWGSKKFRILVSYTRFQWWNVFIAEGEKKWPEDPTKPLKLLTVAATAVAAHRHPHCVQNRQSPVRNPQDSDKEENKRASAIEFKVVHFTYICSSTRCSEVSVCENARSCFWDVSELLKDTILALRSLERLYLVLFLDRATSFRGAAVVCVVSASACVQSCLYTPGFTGIVYDVWLFTYTHMGYAYKYCFTLFIYAIPRCAFLPLTFKCCVFFFPSSFWVGFIIVTLRTWWRRENNLTILRETFSLPSFGNDVMSENQHEARQICYSKRFLSNICVH